MIIVSGTLEIDGESRDQAIAAALEMARATRQEEGCIQYAFYSDLNDPNVFRVYEEWRDLACLKNHFETAHMATFREALSRVKILSRQIKRYSVDEVADL